MNKTLYIAFFLAELIGLVSILLALFAGKSPAVLASLWGAVIYCVVQQISLKMSINDE